MTLAVINVSFMFKYKNSQILNEFANLRASIKKMILISYHVNYIDFYRMHIIIFYFNDVFCHRIYYHSQQLFILYKILFDYVLLHYSVSCQYILLVYLHYNIVNNIVIKHFTKNLKNLF